MEFGNGWDEALVGAPVADNPAIAGPDHPDVFGNGWDAALRQPRQAQGEGVSRNFWDVTGGAALYGGAHAIGSISKLLNRTLSDSEQNSVTSYMEEFMGSHPEYSPEKINGVMDLLSNPGALSSRIFSGLPMMAATTGLLAASAIPGVGFVSVPLAFGLNYGVGAQDAYDRALADGATTDQASRTSTIQGLVYGVLGVLGPEKYLSFLPGAFKSVAGPAVREATEAVNAMGLPATAFSALSTSPAVKSVITAATLNTVQALSDQLIPKGVFGRPFDDDWANQLMESAVIGGATGAVVHGTGTAFAKGLGAGTPIEGPTKELDSYSRLSLRKQLIRNFRYSPADADQYLNIVDAHAKVWGEMNQKDPAEWYSTKLALDDNPAIQAIAQDTSQVGSYYAQLHQVIQDMPQDKWDSKALLDNLLNKQGVKQDALNWTGLTDLLDDTTKIGKKQLLQHLAENQANLVETVHGEDAAGNWTDTLDTIKSKHDEAMIALREAESGMTKFQNHQIATPEEAQEFTDAQKELKDAQKVATDTRKQLDDHIVAPTTFPKDAPSSTLIRLPVEQNVDTAGKVKPPTLLALSHQEGRTAAADKISIIEGVSGDESQHELALLKAMHMAVEDGQDHLALATGDQVVARTPGIDPQEIPAIKKQYDETLRQALEKQAQELDPGTKLEWQQLPDGRQVPSVKITDAMRDKVADGRSLFQRAATWRDLIGAPRVAVAVMKDGTVYAMKGDHGDYLKQGTFKPEDVDHFVTGSVDRRTGTLLTADDPTGGTARDPHIHNIQTASSDPWHAKDFALGEYKVVTNDADYYRQDLFQSNKGSTTFLKNGRAIIRAFQNADLSTGLHELFHVFRRDLSGADHDTAAEWAGAKKNQDGTYTWTREAEEKFARGGERYLREGKAPSPELQSTFEKFKDWLKTIYATIAGSPLNRHLISDEMRGVFDRLFVNDAPEVTKARDVLAQAVLDRTEAEKKAAISPDLFDPNQLTTLREQETAARNELVRTQQAQLIPESPTEARNRRSETLERALAADTPSRATNRWNLSNALLPIRRVLTDRVAGMERMPAGRFLLDGLSNAIAFMKRMVGEHTAEINDTFKRLTKEDKAWLAQVDDKGLSNLRKFIDRAGVPEPITRAPSATLERFYSTARTLFDAGSEAMEQAGVLRHVQGGLIPAVGQDTIRAPRVFTSAAYDAIARGSGPLYEAIIKATQDINDGMDRLELHRRLQKMYGSSVVRESGAVEESRSIKYMPDTVQLNGKPVDVMQKDPYNALMNMIQPTARRVGFIRELGQGLKDVGPLERVAKALGVYDKMSKETLAEALIQAGVPREGVFKDIGQRADDLQMSSSDVPQSLTELKKLAVQAGVKFKPTREDIVQSVQKLTPADFNKRTEVMLRSQARQMKGIDDKAPIEQVLSEVKRRIVEPNQDVLGDVRNAFIKQGGSDQHFVDVVRLAQGLPVGWQPEGGVWRAWKSFQHILGGIQTALAVAPTIPQTLLQVPQQAGIGNYFRAMQDVLRSPSLTRAQGVAMGAIPEGLFRYSTERGFALEKFGSQIRELFGKPMAWIEDLNNSIAYRAFHRLAEQWQLHGMDRGDEVLASRTLKLSQDEIGQIKNGQMSDLTLAKIVQNGVSGTQYHNEPMYRRGVIESNPLGRALFAYSNYTAGTLRSTFEFGSNLFDVIKNGSAKDKAVMGARLVTYLSAAVGAGFASEILRQMFKGNLAQQPPQKDWEHRVLGALGEVGLFGPAQRMMEPMDPLNGDGFDKAFIGMMPQVETLAGVLTQLIGKGKFGKFGPVSGTARVVEGDLPILKAFHNWFDNFAYPDAHAYSDAAIEGRRFERDVLKKKPEPESEVPMEPEAYRVFEHLKRYDLDGGITAAKAYYQEELGKIMGDPVKATLQGKNPSTLAQSLRQNLMAKAPLGLNPLETAKMLSTMPMDQRREIMSAQLRYQAMVNAVAPGG